MRRTASFQICPEEFCDEGPRSAVAAQDRARETGAMEDDR